MKESNNSSTQLNIGLYLLDRIARTRYVDAVYCYRPSIAWSVGLSVCRSVTLVSHAKTAEPIEMPFGFTILVGAGKHVPRCPRREGQFLWKEEPIVSIGTFCGELCKNS